MVERGWNDETAGDGEYAATEVTEPDIVAVKLTDQAAEVVRKRVVEEEGSPDDWADSGQIEVTGLVWETIEREGPLISEKDLGRV